MSASEPPCPDPPIPYRQPGDVGFPPVTQSLTLGNAQQYNVGVQPELDNKARFDIAQIGARFTF
jgi:hypothetical protein